MEGCPFPTMEVRLEKKTVSILPFGPAVGCSFRIDLKCPPTRAAYTLIWNGKGSSINDWTIVPRTPGSRFDPKKAKYVNKESLDEAFQKLFGV